MFYTFFRNNQESRLSFMGISFIFPFSSFSSIDLNEELLLGEELYSTHFPSNISRFPLLIYLSGKNSFLWYVNLLISHSSTFRASLVLRCNEVYIYIFRVFFKFSFRHISILICVESSFGMLAFNSSM